MALKEKTLLFADTAGQRAFQQEVEDTKTRSNDLIRIFTKHQPWLKITTYEDWISLVMNPVQMFDEALLRNVNLTATGMLPDAATVATIFKVDRGGFIEMVKTAITLREYQMYEMYLTFSNGGFTVNQDTVKGEDERFKTYIETEAQQRYYDHWKNLCDGLNKHLEIGFVGPAILSDFGLKAGFRWVPDAGRLYLDDNKIRADIFKLR